ncbi:MAG: MMPL family transporter [Acidobacteria bacterium]|nr:MMPL family transporter [Acidobacteriota bacterium]
MRTAKMPKWLRILLPAVLIVIWVAGGSIGGSYFGKVSEVSSNDQTTYLPSSADATKVQKLLGEFRGSDQIPAVVVFSSDAVLSQSDISAVSTAVAKLRDIPGVGALSPGIPSGDGRAVQAFVPIASTADIGAAVASIGTSLRGSVPSGVSVHVTGPAGFTADLIEGFSGIDGILLGVALLAVFVILILVYRSLLLPVAVLATSLFALCVALLSVWWLAKAGILTLSGQTQGILFILVIGAATDYSLLYVSRYREQLRVSNGKWDASVAAIRGSIEPIAASGGTVIAGLLCLLFSDLKSNSSLGPVAAIGIFFAMLAALTLLPALLYAFGRNAFWPRRPRFEPEVVAAEHGMQASGLWIKLARAIKRRPRMIWVVTTAVLLLGAFGATSLNATGVPQSALVLGHSEARDGQAVLGEHFPAGTGSPVLVVVPKSELQLAANTMLTLDGIKTVSVVSAAVPSGAATVTAQGIQAGGAPASGAASGAAVPEPKVVSGDVMLQGTLEAAADSGSAAAVVRELRGKLSSAVPQALVGGVTATAIDTNDASIHDRNLIIPVVLAVILLLLMMLLRSILAPVLLVLTTVISFGAALGVSAFFFNQVFHFPGADPSVPLFGFIFLVALGIDYNIFLMTRVREESVQKGTPEGIIRGLVITGGVITSAGLVLAATFSALGVIPILFLAQIAFIVAFGVLLDTFIVRSLLVPALSYDIGKAIWWPSKLARPADARSIDVAP